MADVARAAGVSTSTVSRVFSNAPGVADATRELVLREAERLAYVVSPLASGLARGTTRRVGLVVQRVTSWFYATMLGTIEQALRSEGIDVLLYQVDGEEQRTRFFRELPARRKVDAVVLIAVPLQDSESERLGDLKVGVVVTGEKILDYPFVGMDNVAAARQLVGHFTDFGHERIGMIAVEDEHEEHWSSVERTRGYLAALDLAGLKARKEYIVRVPYGAAGGREAAGRLLDLAEPPTAIVAYSDEMALGALSELMRRGIRVPDDVSLAGFDGNPLAELFGLTTIDQQVARQARTAARTAIDLVCGSTPTGQMIFEHRLVERRSVAGVGGGARPVDRP